MSTNSLKEQSYLIDTTVQKNQKKSAEIYNNFCLWFNTLPILEEIVFKISDFNIKILKYSKDSWQMKFFKWEDIVWSAIFYKWQDHIFIHNLISEQKRKWVWKSMISLLVKISNEIWFWWKLQAKAEPLSIHWEKKESNLWFYYKLWFKALNAQVHEKIMSYLKTNPSEDIPLNLHGCVVYLTSKWINRFLNK